MNNHNEYLKQIESYLEDLEVIQKSKILSEIHQEITNKELLDLEDPLIFANKKRAENGFVPYLVKKKFSLSSFLMKSIAIMFLSFLAFISFLIWKFTPIIKVDEEANRVIILGGLIDIDGKSGKFKIVDDYHFSHEGFSNDFQANINLDEDKDEIIVKFDSGSFNLETAKSDQLTVDCKLANPPTNDIISQEEEVLNINFDKIEGLNCALQIPVDKKITIEGNYASLTVPSPEYNLYVELKNGKVYFTPEQEIDYNFTLNIENDSPNNFIGDFESSEGEEAFEIRINLEDGAIIRK